MSMKKCQMTHLGDACAGPMWRSPRYFADGSALYACEGHAKKRQRMGASYLFEPVPLKAPKKKRVRVYGGKS